MSAWVMGPERGLDMHEKEQWTEYDDIPPFQPELSSDYGIRAKVRSSGYGKKVPVKQVKHDESAIVPPWEEVPTFKPKLVRSEQGKKMRKQVQSSGYGRATAQVKSKPKTEAPSFKPKLVGTPMGRMLRKRAASSAYGKAPVSTPERKQPKRPSFRPKLNKNKVFSKVQSSGFGKDGNYKPPMARPQTAPAGGPGRVNTSFSTAFHPGYERISCNTLVTDKPEPMMEPELTERQKNFVLDGVYCAKMYEADKKYCRGTRDVLFPKPVEKVMLTKDIEARAESSSYGRKVPDRFLCERPSTAEGIPSLRFDRRSHLHQSPPPAPKTAMADRIASTGYLSQDYLPKRGEKVEKMPEPSWSPALKQSEGLPGLENLPPAPINRLNESINSNGYGIIAPPKGELVEYIPEPVWVPPPVHPKALPEPPAPPRTNLYNHIGSHYGPGYTPPHRNLHPEDSEEEFSSFGNYSHQQTFGDESEEGFEEGEDFDAMSAAEVEQAY